jgi:hypothetical protein
VQPVVSTGIPVKDGLPLDQHEMQSQTAYLAAVKAGIPREIVGLLPPKALHYNLVLQQAAENKINLQPQQQQQIKSMLHESIEQAKMTLNINATSSGTKTDTSNATTLVMDPSLDMMDFGGYLKEGYKDETFGAQPDLALMTMPVQQEKSEEEEGGLLSWIDTTHLDLGFDFDGSEFVKFDDNESEKLMDDNGKLCVV